MIRMSKKRGTRLKKNTGTIKMYGDPKAVAALLGIDETKETRFYKREKVETVRKEIACGVNTTKDECGIEARAQEESMSDLESLADSLDNRSNNSDSFDSSDGFDSRAYSPSLPTNKQQIKAFVEPSTKLRNAEEEEEEEGEEEGQASDIQNEQELDVLGHVTQQKTVEEIDSVLAGDEEVEGRKEIVANLLNVKVLGLSLPSITDTRGTVQVHDLHTRTTKAANYKPRTLADYKRWKLAQQDRKLGQLGFDHLNPEYQKRLAKASRQQEYSRSIRHKPSDVRHTKKLISLPIIPEQSKREQALEYARKNKQTLTLRVKNQTRNKTSKKVNAELSLVDVMKARHAREKQLIDNLRREVATLR
ncbi:uncharacterized protein LOC134176766 [Corticium candelabrum]|uniref:uncharacterized protein LOC134176766 n=1 Tax=Corticium candelabrum TaxID=121492 RepID=UPI002E26ECED|nr:uncharacterized protein LOC134176766 [Corticium candelabrum]